MVTIEFKERVVEAIKLDRINYPSASKQAVVLDISAAQLSRISNGDTAQVISDAKWLSIGRRLGVSISNRPSWKPAKTPTFNYIYEQLTYCKENSVSGLLCDKADIGKTFTARLFVKEHKNAVYIDCSQVKSKQKLIRQIAKEFGVMHAGKYSDVYADLVYYIQSVSLPIVIIDEAGDLDYPAFLELKALWNASEGVCAWYMMGADGLKAKIESNLERKKVGYTEIFSRFGNSFQKVSPDGKEASEQFTKLQLALVTKANLEQTDVQQLYARTGGSLRKLYDYAKKIK
mgnify:CR=1 FL=1